MNSSPFAGALLRSLENARALAAALDEARTLAPAADALPLAQLLERQRRLAAELCKLARRVTETA